MYHFLSKITLGCLLLLILPLSIQAQKSSNPAAQGFNAAGSDAKAIAIADQVMEAMGGRKAWDGTRYINWNFFGRRNLLWDKKKGQVRIDIPADNSTYIVDLNKETGLIKHKGVAMTQADSIKKYAGVAKSIWINDSYWLLMPYKLKDSGVTLKYKGEMPTEAGVASDVLELTFQGVGRTPENRYLVYVDKTTHLVAHWQHFRKASDEKPGMSTPWENYEKHGKILISGGRGTNRKLTDIQVMSSVPKTKFVMF
ncbi:MAG TPA: hypothetical protein PLC89_14570 [Haliscomenobacter sp.]|uniref:hypothetical protein n=1 Tax=Haliscomenobacter sp. TaxID=2717303 RepID=UPI002C5E56C0|nr:hypothetical protein [Haliscomenobacter sp.]HOY18527.1 hypothetical protein [Haliscomenobacter sp.]HPH20546.1 hypothetical protein [Haliscomenobacter sp.]